MKIKFTEYERVEGERNDGDTWTAYIIHGRKIDGSGNWKSGNIFDNKYNKSIIGKVRGLEAGDRIDVKLTKNGKFWNVSDIVKLSDDEGATSSGGGGGGGYKKSSGKGDAMSKEEWAEKDRVNSLRIAKSVALKAAVENTKVGTSPELVMEMADVWVEWLHAPDMSYEDWVNGIKLHGVDDDGDDPLDAT